LNEETDTILKVKFYSFDEDDEEVIFQKKAGKIAPEIFYNSFRKVGSDIVDRKAFNGDKVQVIIMEYLNPSEWVPLRSVGQLNMYRHQLFEIIYKFIFELNLQNVADFVGNTGPHLFLNEITNKIKVIDYGLFKVSTNPSYDFIMMVKEIQDVLIRWPKEEVMECYKKIMDLSEPITDETCKELALYQGRLFLEGKLRKKRVVSPRRSERLRKKMGKSKKKPKKKPTKKPAKKPNKPKKSKKKSVARNKYLKGGMTAIPHTDAERTAAAEARAAAAEARWKEYIERVRANRMEPESAIQQRTISFDDEQ